MHFLKSTLCISSLLMATASASTLASFDVPGLAPGTAVAPQENTTTTVWETSTHYLTSATTVASTSEASIPANAPAASTPAYGTPIANPPSASSTVVTSSSTSTAVPADAMPSLYISGNHTFIPVTLWEGSTTRVIYPQNSTAMDIPTGYPTNHTIAISTSTVTLTSSVSANKTVGTTSKPMTPTVSAYPSASVSEVPINAGGKITGNAIVAMGAVAGFMALL